MVHNILVYYGMAREREMIDRQTKRMKERKLLQSVKYIKKRSSVYIRIRVRPDVYVYSRASVRACVRACVPTSTLAIITEVRRGQTAWLGNRLPQVAVTMDETSIGGKSESTGSE